VHKYAPGDHCTTVNLLPEADRCATSKITAPSSAPSQSGDMFSNVAASSQPQATDGLFGGVTQSNQTGGGLFGGASQSTQTGGLFGTSTSKPPQSGGLFGGSQLGGGLFGGSNTQSSQSGGLFGGTGPQPAHTGGLFGGGTSQPTQSDSLFGGGGGNTQSGGLFGGGTSQPVRAGGLSGNPASTGQAGGLFAPSNTQGLSIYGPAQSAQQQTTGAPTLGTSFLGGTSTSNTSSGTKIDAEHLRSTTKFDQLNDQLQNEIAALDGFILRQIQLCNEVSDVLPSIAASGVNLPNDVAYVVQKLEEIEIGLENDAEEIVTLRDGIVKKDIAETKVCFRSVDRLKMPTQYQNHYQVPSSSPGSGITGGAYGGSGLSGWWNHPQTLQRSVRGTNGGSHSLTLPGEDDPDEAGGPANMVDLIDRRTSKMKTTLKGNTELLKEIEGFVESVELKIMQKERDLLDGNREPEDPINMLRFVFGAVEKSMYDVADKVGSARDSVQELVLGSVDRRLGSRLDW
jgi:nucleoporin p58/p45